MSGTFVGLLSQTETGVYVAACVAGVGAWVCTPSSLALDTHDQRKGHHIIRCTVQCECDVGMLLSCMEFCAILLLVAAAAVIGHHTC